VAGDASAGFRILEGGLDDARVIALVEHHVSTSRAQTAEGSAHSLAADSLRAPHISFWSMLDGDDLVAIGALRRLSDSHGEIKSMHVAENRRGQGAGGAMLAVIMAAARNAGLKQLSLETGSWDYFLPARALYRRRGFTECPPFPPYKPDPNSLFFTRTLEE
jgi:putative acetyltransferase